MAAVRRFLFDNSFDLAKPAPPPVVEEEPPAPEPVEPTFSAAEVEAAKREGFEAGRQQGQSDAMDSIEQSLATALQSTGDQLAELLALQRAGEESRRAEAMEISLSSLGAIFPSLLETFGLAEIESAIGQALKGLQQEPRVVIRVADEMIDPLRGQVDALSSHNGFEGKLVLVPDAALGPGSVRIEWASGGAERDCMQTWQELQTLIDERIAVLRNVPSDAGTTDNGPDPGQPAETPVSTESSEKELGHAE